MSLVIRIPENVCDFCSAPDPPWIYPCEAYRAPLAFPEQIVVRGIWLACEACADDIEACRLAELTTRAMIRVEQDLPSLTPAQRAQLSYDLRRIHQKFMEFRTGPRKRRFDQRS